MRPIHFVSSLAALALLGSAGAAFAHPPQWTAVHGYRGHAPATRAVAVAPRWVRVAPPPAIVYAAPLRHNRPFRIVRPRAHVAAGALAGAIAGALIGGSLAHGEQHLPAVAVGSVIGAVVGHEIAGGH